METLFTARLSDGGIMTRPSLLPYRGGVHGQGVLCRHFSALPRLLAARIRLQVSPGPAAMGQTPLESGGRFFRFQRERFLYSRKRGGSQACPFLYGLAPACVFPCRFALQTADGVRLPSLENAGGAECGAMDPVNFYVSGSWPRSREAARGKGPRRTRDSKDNAHGFAAGVVCVGFRGRRIFRV